MAEPMKILCLFRHAEAMDEAASGRDFDRRLTEKGQAHAAAIGSALAAAARFDRVLVSEAARAWETWRAIAPALECVEAQVHRALYMAGPQRILEFAAQSGGDAVLVIGHNPGLRETAESLAPGSAPRLRKASGVLLALDGFNMQASARLVQRINLPT